MPVLINAKLIQHGYEESLTTALVYNISHIFTEPNISELMEGKSNIMYNKLAQRPWHFIIN